MSDWRQIFAWDVVPETSAPAVGDKVQVTTYYYRLADAIGDSQAGQVVGKRGMVESFGEGEWAMHSHWHGGMYVRVTVDPYQTELITLPRNAWQDFVEVIS